MSLKSNFQQNNKKIFSILLLVFFAITPLSAAKNNKSCEYRAFNIKTSSKVTNIDLLTQIADACNFTMLIKDDYAKEALKNNLDGVNIKNMSLSELFDLLIGDSDLYYSFNDNVLKISSLKTKIFRIDYITSIRNGTAVLNASVDATPVAGGGGAKTVSKDNAITSSDSFDFWAKLSNELMSVLNTNADKYKAEKPIINSNAGIVTVTATKKQLDRVQHYIEVLQKRLQKQVLINVRIISVDLSADSSSGIDWSKFKLSLGTPSTDTVTGGATAGINLNGSASGSSLKGLSFANNAYTIVGQSVFTIEGLIDFLKTNGNTKIVSSPKVLTLNNQQALITIGDNINYNIVSTTQPTVTGGGVTQTNDPYSIFIGVLLNITPEISDNNEIILRINPSVSNFKYTADETKQARTIAPDTSEKKLSTVVRIKNGDTIILGGLITNSKGKTHSSVPILSEIPLLGGAFRHTGDSLTSQELIFVITPKIIGVKGINKTSLRELGFSKRIYE